HRPRRHQRSSDTIRYQPRNHTTDRAGADHNERPDLSQPRVATMNGNTRANHHGYPDPHGVELPHVPEVTKTSEPHTAITKHANDLRHVELRGRQSVWTILDKEQHDETANRCEQ